MAEQLADAEGAKIEIDGTDAEFAAAMASPPGGDLAAPPRLDPADPDAPYGRTVSGKPKKAPGGRPPRAERARTTDKAAGASSAPAEVDYAAGLGDTIDGAGLALTLVPSDMAKAQAAILARNRDSTITGLTLAAQNNSFARRVITPLATGKASWYILAALALAPAVMQSVQLWQGGPHGPMVAELAAEADANLAGQLEKLGITLPAETTDSDAAGNAESPGEAPAA